MAHFNGNQYDNFHFDPNSLGTDWKYGTQPPHGLRPFASILTKLNINYAGPRSSADYTRTTLGFGFKGTIENPQREMGAGFGTDPGYFVYNPYTWGYAIAHLRANSDPMWKLTEKRGTMAPPRHDVMDGKEVVQGSAMTAYINYPTEGWSSFGKKYDKQQYWGGNTWIATSTTSGTPIEWA